MPDHKHDWYEHQRLAGDKMQERCACGETRTRAMTKAEAADYKTWRDEMRALDEGGDHRVG